MKQKTDCPACARVGLPECIAQRIQELRASADEVLQHHDDMVREQAQFALENLRASLDVPIPKPCAHESVVPDRTGDNFECVVCEAVIPRWS